MDKIRVTLTLPVLASSDLLTLIGTLQRSHGAALDVDIRHIKVAAPAVAPAAEPATAAAEPAAPAAATTPAPAAKVAYQVVPAAGAWRPHTVPERVRTFLLGAGPHTANEVASHLGITRHSAESAIHVLRSSGYLRTIDVTTIRPPAPEVGAAVEQA